MIGKEENSHFLDVYEVLESELRGTDVILLGLVHHSVRWVPYQGGPKARRDPQVIQLASRTSIPPQHESFGLYHGDPWRKLSERRHFLDHQVKALRLGSQTFGEMGAFLSSPDFSNSENNF